MTLVAYSEEMSAMPATHRQKDTPELFLEPAGESDRSLVRHLVPVCLGDHDAYADCLLDNHLSGRADCGNFSLSQQLHIVRHSGSAKQRVGLINLVPKRQGTVKIGPLFVLPEFRGHHAVAPFALRYFED